MRAPRIVRHVPVERRLRAGFAAALALSESDTLVEAAPRILRALGESLEWDLGALWRIDPSAGHARCVDVWHSPNVGGSEFEDASRQTALPPGLGLPGKAWATGRPAWLVDVIEDASLIRAGIAAKEGLHGAVAFPIMSEANVLGVIEFFSRKAEQPDQGLLDMMYSVGAQVGQFIERRGAEEAIRASDARKSAMLEAALDSVITIDHRGRIMDWNPAAEACFGFSHGEVLGRQMADLIIPPGLREQHRHGLARYLATGREVVLRRHLELTALRADGTEFPVELTITRVDLPGPPLFTAYVRDITGRKLAEEEHRHGRELHQLVLDNVEDLVSLVDPQGTIVLASASHQRILGYEPDELIGTNALDLVHPDDVSIAQGAMLESMSRPGTVSEVRVRHKDGRWIWLEGSTALIPEEQGRPKLLLASSRDVTERKHAAELMRELAAIVESSNDAIIGKTLEGRITSWNPGAQRLYGYTAEEVMGRSIAILAPPDRGEEIAGILAALGRGERVDPFETERVRKDGARFHVSLTVSPIRDHEGRVVGASTIARDITERKAAEAEIGFLAFHDGLTGLPNRTMFEELLEMALARARRRGSAVALLYVDLDDFKLVNDTLGHSAGDELLLQVSAAIREGSRQTDLVARLGGDEFLVLLADLDRGDRAAGKDPWSDALVVAESVAARIHESLRRDFRAGGSEVSASASIGISLYPLDAEDGRLLMKNADAAMYRSKKDGPGGSLVYAREVRSAASTLSFTARLRQATESHSWTLHYQPVMDLPRGQMIGVEALLRWQDPNRGLIPPGEFIPMAEEMGLIESIGDWVVEEIARQSREWKERGLKLSVGFNLSWRELWRPNAGSRIAGHLESAGVDPSSVIVEVTEATVMGDPERTQRILWDLRNHGLRLALDDFGTSYSSLARLRHLPIDFLKIDRLFISEVPDDPDSGGMVRAIIQLARGLGMTPVAVGVETKEQWQFLVENRCRLGQGYFFSRPVPAAEIESTTSRKRLRVVRGEGTGA